MATKHNRSLVIGVLLIAAGAVLLLTRLAVVDATPVWLLGVGLALALVGVLQRGYALLTVGMILLGLGAGMVLGEIAALGLPLRAWRLVALGGGFVGLYLLSTLLKLRSHWWPLIPGGALVAFGLAPFLRTLVYVPPQVEAALRTWWPALLVVFGAGLVLSALRR